MSRDYGITNAAPYATAPAVGANGDTYWNTTEKAHYISDGTAWRKSPAATIASAAPSNPVPGMLWWRPDDAVLYIYYDDGNSAQWVQASP